MINIKFDTSDIAKVHLLLGEIKNGAPKVMTHAINKTLTGVQTDAVKAIAIDLNLTQERIREDFYINKASFEFLSGSVVATGKPVNFASFSGTTETKSDYGGGVSVKIKKSGSRIKFKHAFIWERTTKSGNEAKTAFQREWHEWRSFRSRFSPWKKFGPKYILPLETLNGPRIEDEYAKDRVISSVQLEAKARLDQNLAHELDYELSKLK